MQNFQFIVFARNMGGGRYTTNPPEMKDFFSSSLSPRSISPLRFSCGSACFISKIQVDAFLNC